MLFLGLAILPVPSGFESPGGEGLRAEETPVVTARPIHRKLKIIPFSNLTGSSNLDYLETGLPEMILNTMNLPVFIRDFRPPDVVLDPAGRIRQGNPYSTPELQESVLGREKDKIRLEGSVHRWQLNQGELVEKSSGFGVAARIDADYLLKGNITGTRSNPVLELEFYDAVWGKKSATTIALPGVNPYDDSTLNTIRRFAESRLPGLGSGRIRVSSEKAGALVFLDDVYMGKTPLDENVAPGRYELRVSHEQCKEFNRSIELSNEESFRVECSPAGGRSTLVVESQPPGASVFLNLQFLGTTPLKVEELAEGTHRVRISLEDHIDRFQGVKLEREKTSRISVNLTKGDTEEFYRDPGYVIADWTHHDLAFGLMLQSLALGGGWAYSTIRANDVRDSIRAEIPSLLITDLPSYSLYQFQKLQNNRLDAKVWDNRANLFAGAAVASIVFSGLFLWLGYEHDDKEFGELSLLEYHLKESQSGKQQLQMRQGGQDSSAASVPKSAAQTPIQRRQGSDSSGLANHPPPAQNGAPDSLQWFWTVDQRPLAVQPYFLPSGGLETQHRLGLQLHF